MCRSIHQVQRWTVDYLVVAGGGGSGGYGASSAWQAAVEQVVLENLKESVRLLYR